MATATLTTPRTPVPVAPRTRRRLSERAQAALMIAPTITIVLIFIYGFLFWTIFLSFMGWNDVTFELPFRGLNNFVRLYESDRFWIDIQNQAKFSFFFVGQCLGLGFLLAVLLDRPILGESFFKTIYIFPFAVSSIVTGVIWRWLMYPDTGLNLLFRGAGLGFLENKWYAEPSIGIIAVSVPAAWQMTGYTMALFLATLRGISSDQREAAAMDGATGWQYYRYVAFPACIPTAYSATVIIGMLSMRTFDLPAAMTGGAGAGYRTDMPTLFMFETTFQQYRYSVGAAIATLMIAVSLVLLVPYLRDADQN
ncbi:MAG: carbohydrate ABC transporter permease [Chloroflexota bacterium]|nr:sugar ABC transporter permease [Pseudomonadota bacterium]